MGQQEKEETVWEGGKRTGLDGVPPQPALGRQEERGDPGAQRLGGRRR